MRSRRSLVTGLMAVGLILASALACAASGASGRGRYDHHPSFNTAGYKAFVMTVPNRLSRWEARRRLQSGLVSLQRQYGSLFRIREERWIGYRLRFRATVLGQPAYGGIEIARRSATLTVFLPWLVEGLVELARPAMVKAATALLERQHPRRHDAP